MQIVWYAWCMEQNAMFCQAGFIMQIQVSMLLIMRLVIGSIVAKAVVFCGLAPLECEQRSRLCERERCIFGLERELRGAAGLPRKIRNN